MPSVDLTPSPLSPLTHFRKSQFTKPVPTPPAATLTGQTAIITGSNSGLGLECCRQFLSLHLSHLIIAVRRTEAGENAAAPLRIKYPKSRIEVWGLDMANYNSIQEFSKKCEALGRLDVVVLNAGLAKHSFNVVEGTGHEEMFQVNYLSTALLSFLLLPILRSKCGERAGKPGRLTIVGSGLSLHSKFENRNTEPLIPSFSSPQVAETWSMDSGNERYSLTKTLLLMFILKLSNHVDPRDVIVNVVDPALCKGSELQRPEHSPAIMRFIIWILKVVAARSLEVGASTYVDATVVKGPESHGSFCCDWKVFPFHKLMYTEEGVRTTDRLWEETLTELQFANVRTILEKMQ